MFIDCLPMYDSISFIVETHITIGLLRTMRKVPGTLNPLNCFVLSNTNLLKSSNNEQINFIIMNNHF